MTKFKVLITEHREVSYIVPADTEAEACEKALEGHLDGALFPYEDQVIERDVQIISED